MNLNDIIQSFKNNEKNLYMANKIDECEFKFNFNKAIEILEQFKSFHASFISKKAIAVTNGNPYITIILCMQAISQDVKLNINIQNTMPCLNETIVKIFNLHFQDEGPKLTEYMSPRDFIHAEADDIVVIDDRSKYYFLRDELKIKVRYASLLNIDLYTDSDELSSLTETIYDYCNQKFIGVNIHKNESIDDFVNEANKYDSGNIALILTKNQLNTIDISDKLENKKVYFNCNPFSNIESEVALKNILK